MAAIPLRVRGLNVVLVVFSLLVLGGAAAFMEANLPANIQSRASNVTQNLTGKLVKKGTVAFSPCKAVTTNYALIIPQPAGSTATVACSPLSVQSAIADPLVGKQIVATGTLQSGVFYATSLTATK